MLIWVVGSGRKVLGKERFHDWPGGDNHRHRHITTLENHVAAQIFGAEGFMDSYKSYRLRGGLFHGGELQAYKVSCFYDKHVRFDKEDLWGVWIGRRLLEGNGSRMGVWVFNMVLCQVDCRVLSVMGFGENKLRKPLRSQTLWVHRYMWEHIRVGGLCEKQECFTTSIRVVVAY